VTGRDVLATSAVIGAVLLVGCTASASPPARVVEELKRSLKGEPNAAQARVTETPGPLGTTVVMAAIPDAYPGTGVRRVVLDNGTSYGVHGEKDLAELVRARGWLAKPPAFDAYCGLVDAALFEGLSAYDEASPHRLEQKGGALELQFVRRLHPSNTLETVTVRVAAAGNATVATAASKPASAPTGGRGDPVAAAERALAGGNAAEITAAIRGLSGKVDARARAVLARATLSAESTVAGDAMLALGDSPETVTALKAAWKSVRGERRAALLQLATEFFGAEFAAKLK
jgi:hypothetical protein